MYIKKSWFTKNGKRYITYQIAESYRPGRGKNPRTRILATITHLGKPLIDKIALLLKFRDAKVIPDLASFFKQSYLFGAVVFLYLFMRQMRVIDCLNIIPRRARVLLVAVILNRILDPRSKLGSISWVKKTAFPFLFGIEKNKLVVNRIYEAMDILHNKMDKVLDSFFQENKKHTVLLLYDITSIFFEGKGPEELSRYGYSRDKRSGNPQILLSLCLNEEKMPIYFDILRGNIQDKATVIPLIKELRKRFNLSQSIFVGDRGMVRIENLEFLEKDEGGIDYIIALTHTEARELIFKQDIQPELFDKRIPVTVFIEEGKNVKRRYVLCGSEHRKWRDQELLEHLLKRGRAALEGVKKMVDAGRLKDPVKVIRRAQKKLTESKCEKFYDFKYEDGRFLIIEKTSFIERARALCGYYILRTTVVGMGDEEVEAHYKELKFVEDSFRQLKDLVEIRPIFHWKNRRVRTHIFLCILAQCVVNRIRDRLKSVGWLGEGKANTVSHFLDILEQINVGIFEIEGVEAKIITRLTVEHRNLLGLFDLEEKYFTSIVDVQKICRLI